MDLHSIILNTEKKFTKPLEDFFIRNWGDNILISHGIGHHRRVWHYSKEIMYAMHDSGIKTSPDLPDRLILASYLHDIGMSVDPGERHGKFSGELCRQYISENHLDERSLNEVIAAVELHDQKDYNLSSNGKSLLSILSVADDLDAFGYIGIYRYLEIYITRGISGEIAARLIKTNAERRYQNFLVFSSGIKSLVEKHKQRYLVLCHFFNDFLSKLETTGDKSEKGGHSGVSKLISGIINDRSGEREIPGLFTLDYNDQVINEFTSGYLRETEQFPALCICSMNAHPEIPGPKSDKN